MESGFVEQAVHRQDLASGYNLYRRPAHMPAWSHDDEDFFVAFYPLFTTAFLLGLFLEDQNAFGAQTVVFSSASSKTALSSAFCLRHALSFDCNIVGLTSARNRSFCTQTGFFDRVLEYKDLSELDATKPPVYVDFSGIGSLLREVHKHFGNNLRHSASVGTTHYAEIAPQKGLAGPKPAFFFAPEVLNQKNAELGMDAVLQAEAKQWRPFHATIKPFLNYRHHQGASAVQQLIKALASGDSDPRNVDTCSLGEEE